jgi:hypothetical protein
LRLIGLIPEFQVKPIQIVIQIGFEISDGQICVEVRPLAEVAALRTGCLPDLVG